MNAFVTVVRIVFSKAVTSYVLGSGDMWKG